MKDIDLKSVDGATWDLNFEYGDLVELKDENQVLENGIILSVLTQLGEISPNPTYGDYGSRLYKLVKQNKNELTNKLLIAYIKEAVEKIHRISEVKDIKIQDDETIIYVIKNNGDNAILKL